MKSLVHDFRRRRTQLNDDNCSDSGALTAFLPFLGVLMGCVLGRLGATWVVRSAPDLLPIFVVPVNDRGSVAPGPPIVYWLTWLVPPAIMYGVGALLLWRSRRGRAVVAGFLIGFTLIYVGLASLWISLDTQGSLRADAKIADRGPRSGRVCVIVLERCLHCSALERDQGQCCFGHAHWTGGESETTSVGRVAVGA